MNYLTGHIIKYKFFKYKYERFSEVVKIIVTCKYDFLQTKHVLILSEIKKKFNRIVMMHTLKLKLNKEDKSKLRNALI